MRIFQIIIDITTIFFALEKWFFMYMYEVEIFKRILDYGIFYIFPFNIFSLYKFLAHFYNCSLYSSKQNFLSLGCGSLPLEIELLFSLPQLDLRFSTIRFKKKKKHVDLAWQAQTGNYREYFEYLLSLEIRKQQDRSTSFDFVEVNKFNRRASTRLLARYLSTSTLPPPFVDRRDDYSKRGCINETRLQSP